MSPVAVVTAQLAALGCGDFAAAFGLNSAANQKRFGSAGNFERTVSSSASFRLLLDPECNTTLSPETGLPSSVRVVVVGTGGGQAACFVFDLVQSEAGYATDCVRIEC